MRVRNRPPRRRWLPLLMVIYLLGGGASGFAAYSRVYQIAMTPPPANTITSGTNALQQILGTGQADTGTQKFKRQGTYLTKMPDFANKGRINILVLGIDARVNAAKSNSYDSINTDVMMLVSIDPYARIVHLLSIPRDLWVNVPGCGMSRINAAYACGDFATAEQVVTNLTGAPINYYAMLDFVGFQEAIDKIGGVTIDVQHPVRDDSYPGANYSYTHLYIEPGPQRMDGFTALRFARTRHADSDFGRNQRQQEVIRAIRTQLLAQNIWADPVRAINLVQFGLGLVQTNVPAGVVNQLQDEFLKLHIHEIDSQYITEQMAVPWVTPGGADVLLPQLAAIHAMTEQMFTDSRRQVQDENATVQIENATGDPNAGTDLAKSLGANYVHVAGVSNLPAGSAKSAVIDTKGDQVTRTLLGRWLGLDPATQVRFDPLQVAPNGADIVIVLGTDFQGVS